MRCVRLLLASILIPISYAHADEPARPLQVVTPKEDGIIASGINERGDVIGFEWIEDKDRPGVVDQVPFLARGKQLTYLPVLEGYTATFPAGVSDEGVVVGRSSKPAPVGVRIPLRNQAFVWDEKTGMKGLGAMSDDWASFATGISQDGKRISGFSVGDDRVRPCVWDREGDGWKGSVLPSESKLGSTVVSISRDGKRIAAADGGVPCLWSEEAPGVWKREVIGTAASLVPRAVNNAGMVAGVRFTNDGYVHAVIWTREGGVKQLDKPLGYARSEANAVNDAGVVVGMIDGVRGSMIGPDAFVYENGKVRVIRECGPFFTSANAINDRGQVAGVFEKDDDQPPAEASKNEPAKTDKPTESTPPHP